MIEQDVDLLVKVRKYAHSFGSHHQHTIFSKKVIVVGNGQVGKTPKRRSPPKFLLPPRVLAKRVESS